MVRFKTDDIANRMIIAGGMAFFFAGVYNVGKREKFFQKQRKYGHIFFRFSA